MAEVCTSWLNPRTFFACGDRHGTFLWWKASHFGGMMAKAPMKRSLSYLAPLLFWSPQSGTRDFSGRGRWGAGRPRRRKAGPATVSPTWLTTTSRVIIQARHATIRAPVWWLRMRAKNSASAVWIVSFPLYLKYIPQWRYTGIFRKSVRSIETRYPCSRSWWSEFTEFSLSGWK